MSFVIGLLFIAAGVGIIYYRFKIYEFTGEWTWASTYLGSTMNAIVLCGMILIGVGAAYPFGAFDGFNNHQNIIDKR